MVKSGIFINFAPLPKTLGGKQMDFISHFLWFFILTYNKYFAKGKKFFKTKWNKTAGFVFSFAPDIALFPYLAYVGYNLLLGYPLSAARTNVPDWVFPIYQFFHSYLVFLIVAIALFLLAKEYFMPFFIGWGLHITADVFLHKGNFANRPFYPFSAFTINGFFAWDYNPIFILVNFAVIAVIFFLLWWKKGFTFKKFWKEIF